MRHGILVVILGYMVHIACMKINPQQGTRAARFASGMPGPLLSGKGIAESSKRARHIEDEIPHTHRKRDGSKSTFKREGTPSVQQRTSLLDRFPLIVNIKRPCIRVICKEPAQEKRRARKAEVPGMRVPFNIREVPVHRTPEPQREGYQVRIRAVEPLREYKIPLVTKRRNVSRIVLVVVPDTGLCLDSFENGSVGNDSRIVAEEIPPIRIFVMVELECVIADEGELPDRYLHIVAQGSVEDPVPAAKILDFVIQRKAIGYRHI